MAESEQFRLFIAVTVPEAVERLTWTVSARQTDGPAADRLKVSQRVEPAIPVRILTSRLQRLEAPLTVPVAAPEAALAGRGEVRATLAATLGDGLSGMRAYMRDYPYACLEQKASKAVATRNRRAWETERAGGPQKLSPRNHVIALLNGLINTKSCVFFSPHWVPQPAVPQHACLISVC